MFNLDVSGKNAWITGASRGIGQSVAHALAAAGASVVVSYRENEAAAHGICEAIGAKGGKAIAVQLDVANVKSCEDAYAQISRLSGPADILVNAAGVIADNLFLMLSDEDWRKVIDTNLFGVVHTTRLVIKDMMAKRWGRIINFSSVAATRGGRGQTNYAASKGAIEAMTRSLAGELGRRGITVNCIAPGVVTTDMSAEVIKLAKDEILDRQIIKRFASPDEIAAWAVMLASEHAGFMTGQVVHIDGGLRMA